MNNFVVDVWILWMQATMYIYCSTAVRSSYASVRAHISIVRLVIKDIRTVCTHD